MRGRLDSPGTKRNSPLPLRRARVVAPTIEASRRPFARNPDGSISTVRTISIGTDQGEVLIPTIIGGKHVSNDEAIAHYKRTGQHLGIYPDIATANKAAVAIHNSEAKRLAQAEALVSAYERDPTPREPRFGPKAPTKRQVFDAIATSGLVPNPYILRARLLHGKLGALGAHGEDLPPGTLLTGTAFGKDLHGELFFKGTGSTYRLPLLSKQNRNALLGPGDYMTQLPKRANEFARLDESSNFSKNYNTRFTARGTYQGLRGLAERLHESGHLAGDGWGGPLMPHPPVYPDSMPVVGGRTAEKLAGMSFNGQYTWKHIRERVGYYAKRVKQLDAEMRRARLRGRPTAQLYEDQRAAQSMHTTWKTARDEIGLFGRHQAMHYKEATAPQFRAQTPREGLRLFDLQQPFNYQDVRDAARELAKIHVYLQKKKGLERGIFHAEPFGGDSRFISHEANRFMPRDELRGLVEETPIATRRDVERAFVSELKHQIGEDWRQVLREGKRLGNTQYGDALHARDPRHLLQTIQAFTDNPFKPGVAGPGETNPFSSSSVLQRMGYHGVIDPEHSFGGETSKELVLFAPHNIVPYYSKGNKVMNRAIALKKAKIAERQGAIRTAEEELFRASKGTNIPTIDLGEYGQVPFKNGAPYFQEYDPGARDLRHLSMDEMNNVWFEHYARHIREQAAGVMARREGAAVTGTPKPPEVEAFLRKRFQQLPAGEQPPGTGGFGFSRMPVESYPQTPNATQVLGEGYLSSLIKQLGHERGAPLSAQEADKVISALDDEIAASWEKNRSQMIEAPHIFFPRMPTRNTPSFGGLRPDAGPAELDQLVSAARDLGAHARPFGLSLNREDYRGRPPWMMNPQLLKIISEMRRQRG